MGFEQIKVELVSSWGDDRAIAEQAWASSTDKTKLIEKSDDDVRRIITTQIVPLHHDTPKEKVWLDFFITAPIFCERQFDKYRMTVQYQDFQVDFSQAPFGRDGITQNELSGRYRTIPERFYIYPEDVKNIVNLPYERGYKENSSFYEDFMEEQHEFYTNTLSALKQREKNGEITNKQYKRAREVVRGVLGTGFLTDFRIIMNLNAFEHIINQRLAIDTQPESRVIAAKMLDEVRQHQVATITVNQMFTENKWETWYNEIQKENK